MDGEIKIVITPQLKLDIFEEYPVVRKAFEENVDKKVRYFYVYIVVLLRSIPLPSYPNPSSGIGTSSQSSSTHIALLFVLLLHNM